MQTRTSAGQLLTFGAMVAFMSVLSGCSHPTSATSASVRRSESAALPVLKSGRPVYPYSLVPGGIANETEFVLRRASDPVLNAHYREFGAHVKLRSLPRDRWLYASYRIGDQIYWTRHAVLVHGGETVLTDGQHLIRTRCGNSLSSTPRKPTRFIEPSTVSSDYSVTPVLPPDLPPQVPVSKNSDPGLPGIELSLPEPPPDPPELRDPSPLLPRSPAPIFIGGPLIGPDVSPRVPVRTPQLPLLAPEPATWALIAIGLGLIVIHVKRQARRNSCNGDSCNGEEQTKS